MITILPSLKTVVMILMMNVKVVDNKDDATPIFMVKFTLMANLILMITLMLMLIIKYLILITLILKIAMVILISSTTIKVLVMIIQMIEDTLGVVDWSKQQL